MQITKMRLLTDAEYDKLCDICHEDNSKMHWENLFSFVDDCSQTIRGSTMARFRYKINEQEDFPSVGFRPAFEVQDIDNLPSAILNGTEPMVIGTLYMGYVPVRLAPNWWRTEAYRGAAKFSIKEPMSDPDYQIKAYHVGNGVFVADRVLVCNLSRNTLLQALEDAR